MTEGILARRRALRHLPRGVSPSPNADAHPEGPGGARWELVGGVPLLLRPDSSDRVVAEDNLVHFSYFKHGVTLQRGECWLDIGAYIGTFALAASLGGARVVSFEPHPESAELARRNMARNGFTTYELRQCAVVASLPPPGARLQLSVNVHRNNFAANTLLPYWKRPRPAVAVDAVAIEDVMREAAALFGGPFNVKIDCEGGELAILDRWDAAWPVRKLAFEYHYSVDPSLAAARRRMSHLEDLGFTVRLKNRIPEGDVWPGLRIKTTQAWCWR